MNITGKRIINGFSFHLCKAIPIKRFFFTPNSFLIRRQADIYNLVFRSTPFLYSRLQIFTDHLGININKYCKYIDIDQFFKIYQWEILEIHAYFILGTQYINAVVVHNDVNPKIFFALTFKCSCINYSSLLIHNS